jgi:hypothetical protein
VYSKFKPLTAGPTGKDLIMAESASEKAYRDALFHDVPKRPNPLYKPPLPPEEKPLTQAEHVRRCCGTTIKEEK